PRFEPDVAGEAAGVAGDVAAAIIRKPFDRDGQAIDLAKPVLDGSHHQVAHVLAGDAAGSGQEAHGFPITAVELNATRTRSPLSQPISKPPEHQRRLRSSTAMRPSWRRSSPPTWRSRSRP